MLICISIFYLYELISLEDNECYNQYMNSEQPPFDDEKPGEDMEVVTLSPEQIAELLGMEANIAGLEVSLAEKRAELVAMEASQNKNEIGLRILRRDIWSLAEEVEEQKEWVKDSRG